LKTSNPNPDKPEKIATKAPRHKEEHKIPLNPPLIKGEDVSSLGLMNQAPTEPRFIEKIRIK